MARQLREAVLSGWKAVAGLILLAGVVGGALAVKAEPPVDPFYQQRELTAPPAVRQILGNIRATIQDRKLTFHVGYTEVSDKDLKSLCGTVMPNDLHGIARAHNDAAAKLLKLDDAESVKYAQLHPGVIPVLHVAPSPSLRAWDWRTEGKVTPVRHQNCGDCWAYSVTSTLESSYLIRNHLTTAESPYYLVTNSGAGTCEGGSTDAANAFLVAHGTAALAADPDPGTDSPAAMHMRTPYSGVATGFVDPNVDIPTVAQLKEVLCKHGPLSVCVYATPAFQHYTDGVFNEFAPGNIDHAITLIGWNDKKGAWLIKNSWGTGWGDTCGYGTERGFMWIAYGSNKIGFAAQWIRAKSTSYTLPPKFASLVLPYDVIHNVHINPGPLEIPR